MAVRRASRGATDTIGLAAIGGVLAWLAPVAAAQSLTPDALAADPTWQFFQTVGFGGPMVALLYGGWQIYKSMKADAEEIAAKTVFKVEATLAPEDRVRLDRAVDAINRNTDAIREARP